MRGAKFVNETQLFSMMKTQAKCQALPNNLLPHKGGASQDAAVAMGMDNFERGMDHSREGRSVSGCKL